jgi:hypothetical protein
LPETYFVLVIMAADVGDYYCDPGFPGGEKEKKNQVWVRPVIVKEMARDGAVEYGIFRTYMVRRSLFCPSRM